MSDFFTAEIAQKYDDVNRKLSAIKDCLHLLLTLVFKPLPDQARVLCVGVGTGSEILALAKVFPQWTFVGLDPSENMLNVCRERIQSAGLANRCDLVHGYIQDLPHDIPFDAALSILVGHFIPHKDKLSYFQTITSHLKQDGRLANVEVSFDLNSAEYPLMLEAWKQVQLLMGAPPESIANLPHQLKETLSISAPAEMEVLLKQSGVALPIRFFQSFMICGWFGQKA